MLSSRYQTLTLTYTRLTAKGRRQQGVYQNELNLLIHHYKELIKLFRRNQEKKSLALAKARLVYWTELQGNSEQEDWHQVKMRHKAKQPKGKHRKADSFSSHTNTL